MAGVLHETSELCDRHRVLVDPESVNRHDPHWTLLRIEALRAHPEAAPRHFDHVLEERGCLHRSPDYAALPGSRITWSASTTRLTTRPARTASASDARRRPARCAANPAQNPSEIDSSQTTIRIPSLTEAPAANAATKIASGGTARRSIRDSRRERREPLPTGKSPLELDVLDEARGERVRDDDRDHGADDDDDDVSDLEVRPAVVDDQHADEGDRG